MCVYVCVTHRVSECVCVCVYVCMYVCVCVSVSQSVKHLAELGVVFLLFNIGLELSVERLASMAKYVFGMGTFQVGCIHTQK